MVFLIHAYDAVLQFQLLLGQALKAVKLLLLLLLIRFEVVVHAPLDFLVSLLDSFDLFLELLDLSLQLINVLHVFRRAVAGDLNRVGESLHFSILDLDLVLQVSDLCDELLDDDSLTDLILRVHRKLCISAVEVEHLIEQTVHRGDLLEGQGRQLIRLFEVDV